MTNKRKTPDSAATNSGGLNSNQLKTDANRVASALLQLQRQFPDFFRDVKDDDLDMDLESSFDIYEKIRQADAG